MYKIILGAVLTFGIAMNASALVIQNAGDTLSGTDVGDIDLLVAQTGKKIGGSLANSNPETEEAWVNSVLDLDTQFTVKTENVNYYATNQSNIFTFALNSAPEYYVVKNSQYWALYSNTNSLDWAVFDATELFKGFNLPDMGELTISHVTEFGSDVTPVPLPAGLPLLAAALAALGWFRRRSARQA